MRSNVAEYALIAPPTLTEALQTLAQNPTRYTPIAGGTELMVALSAGRLPQKHLLSINHLRELRFIEVTPTTITIGSGATFTDIRRHAVIAADLPLLAQAASWTGSIANQNRGTIGGNIVNASPAADSPPALLAYDATLTLISASRNPHHPLRRLPPQLQEDRPPPRRAPPQHLHQTQLLRLQNLHPQSRRPQRPGHLQDRPRMLSPASKNNAIIQDIRIGAASLRETPTRCPAAEQALLHQPLTPATLPTLIAAARAALATEARPIDDIRSTAKYRAAVAANLLEEFVSGCCNEAAMRYSSIPSERS